MTQLWKKFALDRTTWFCSLVCSAAFLFWSYGVVGNVGPELVVFFLLMPVAFFCLGYATLNWLRFPIRSSHPFPMAFLFGTVLATLLLFVLHLVVPLSLRVIDVFVLLVALLAQAIAPVAGRQPKSKCSPLTGSAVILTMLAATLWTQDLRPYSVRERDAAVFKPWSDIFVHAQLVGLFRADTSTVKLGDPDLAGRHLPFYHYASYMLPASVEVWSASITAIDSLALFWIPFGFALMGFAAFSLAAQWWGDLAGFAAIAAVLVVPDAPVYAIPLNWYSFHWLIAISAALAYGIASAAMGLVLITSGVQANRYILLLAGLALLAGTVVLKAHLMIVAMPLGIAWVLCFKQGWTGRRRLFITAAIVFGALISLFILNRLKIGPNIVPNSLHSGVVGYLSGIDRQIRPGNWRQLVDPYLNGKNLPHALVLTLVVIAAPLGGWLIAWIALTLINLRQRRLTNLDALPIMTLAIYLCCVFVVPSNQRGAIDELWHRPFVWLYFIFAVWCSGEAVQLLIKQTDRTSRWHSLAIVSVSAVLLVVPLIKGKSIQQSWQADSDFFNTRLDAGFLDCATFLREHSAQTDVVQDQVLTIFPFLSALSERRAYLGRSPDFWQQAYASSPNRNESLRRSDLLKQMRQAESEEELRKLITQAGIRWYVARPNEILSWPKQRLEAPAFTSYGFRIYDLAP
jgi:hypothetical protein